MSSAEDRLGVGAMLDEYAHAVDAKDWDRLASLFTADAVLDYTASGGPRASRDDAVAWLREVLAAFTMTQHLIVNRVVEVAGEAASSTCAYFNPMQPAEGPLFFVGGTYRTRYRRENGAWRIAEHVQTISWTTLRAPGH